MVPAGVDAGASDRRLRHGLVSPIASRRPPIALEPLVRPRRTLLIGLLLLSASCATATQLPKTRPVEYSQWGFTVEVPYASVRESVSAQGPTELWDLFRYGDLVYSVQVIKPPPETLSATAVEQAIQARSAEAKALGGARRWEIESRGGDLFKGLSGPLPRDETSPDSPVLRKAIGNREAHRCFGMTPLGGEFSPIACLGVTGPKNRSSEIDDLARFFAFRFTRAASDAAEPAKPPPPPPSPAARPAKPLKLKKGDIELLGRVEFVDAGRKSLSMMVDMIRLPHTGYIELRPARRKIVFYAKPLPAAVKPDSTISVIGFNTGVGKPIKADSIAPAALPNSP